MGLCGRDIETGELDQNLGGIDMSEVLNRAKENKKIKDLKDVEKVRLDDPRKLGIATLGALKQHPRISAFRRFIEGWHLSYFTPNAARSLPACGDLSNTSIR